VFVLGEGRILEQREFHHPNSIDSAHVGMVSNDKDAVKDEHVFISRSVFRLDFSCRRSTAKHSDGVHTDASALAVALAL